MVETTGDPLHPLARVGEGDEAALVGPLQQVAQDLGRGLAAVAPGRDVEEAARVAGRAVAPSGS